MPPTEPETSRSARSRAFPTRTFSNIEFGLRAKAAGLLHIPESAKVIRRTPWNPDGDTWTLSIHLHPRGGSVSTTRIEIVRAVGRGIGQGADKKTSVWSDGPLEAADHGGLPAIFRRTLEILYDGELPALGSTVMLPDESLGVVDEVTPKRPMREDKDRNDIANLGLYLRGKRADGTPFSASLENVRPAQAELPAAGGLLTFAPGQPVFVDGDRAGTIQSVERGQFGGVRLKIKASGRGEFWCNPGDTRLVPGWTPMHSAALRDDASLVRRWPEEQVRAVLKEEVTTPSRCWWTMTTPLHVAARFNHMTAYKALVARGADAGAEDARGETPFTLLAAGGRGGAWAVESGCGEQMATLALEKRLLSSLYSLVEAGFNIDRSIADGPSIRQTITNPDYIKNKAHYTDPKHAKLVKQILNVGEARKCPHTVKQSQSSKTKCKHCRKKIAKNTSMFGIGVVTATQTVSRTWYHLECAKTGFPKEFQEYESAQ